MADISVEDAVTRNCQALVAGNFAQIFADMTPQAMAKLSQTMAANAQQLAGQPPRFERYEIVAHERQGEEHLYDVRFHGDTTFGVRARWQEIEGAWKLTDFDPYAVTGTPAAGA